MTTEPRRLGAARSRTLAAAWSFYLAASVGQAGTIHDLQADWSEVANPHGVWSYNQGDRPMPRVANWPLDRFVGPQGGWAVGSTIPFWFQCSAAPRFLCDWRPGDIVVHTHSPGDGPGNGPANVTWASPTNGLIDIAGSLWQARDIGRSNRWNLVVRDALVSSGCIASGDPYSRADPMSLADGSGGAAALQGLHVSAGDVVKLEIVRAGDLGDYVGVNLTIREASSNSEPSRAIAVSGRLALFAAGICAVLGALTAIGLWLWCRRRPPEETAPPIIPPTPP